MERNISEDRADEISPFTHEIVSSWLIADRDAAIFAKAPKFTRKSDPSEEYAFAIVKHRVVETIQGAETIGGSISVTARLSFGDRGECTKQWFDQKLIFLKEGNVVTLDEYLRVIDVFDCLLTFLDCIQKGYIVLTPGSDEVMMVPKKKEGSISFTYRAVDPGKEIIGSEESPVRAQGSIKLPYIDFPLSRVSFITTETGQYARVHFGTDKKDPQSNQASEEQRICPYCLRPEADCDCCDADVNPEMGDQ